MKTRTKYNSQGKGRKGESPLVLEIKTHIVKIPKTQITEL